jgi:sugar lactone lactonase YvrE
MKLIKTIVLSLGIVLAALAVYLGWWPVPVHAVAWNAPAAPGYVGPHATNTRLSGLTLIPLGDESGPEHLAFGPDGKLYTGVLGGKVLRMQPDGSGIEVFAKTDGRILGIDFDAQGRLIAADAVKGLVAIGRDGRVSVLTDHVGEDPIRYADAVIVAKSGKIYFSDASRRFAPAQWGGTLEAALLDIIEQAATGRILEYDPDTQRTRVVAKGLSFANGVALSEDQRSLFVAETGRYRVWKIAVDANELDVAKPSPQAVVVLDNLPGYPDNLMRGQQGRIWVGLSGPRSPDIDALSGKPFMRELILRLPRALWPLPKRHGHVFAFAEDGRVVDDMQDPSGAYWETTGATESADRVYVQNLHLNVIGWRAR